LATGAQIRMRTNGKGRPYCELGKVLDALARERDVRGPSNIAHRVQDAGGYEVSGQALSKYLYGESLPKRQFIEAFAEAFVLTPQERAQLAWVYAYGSRSGADFLFRRRVPKEVEDNGERHAWVGRSHER
jgi:hypothetical protein